IEAVLAAGRDVVTDIDWQGTQQLDQSVGGDLVTVFILPPSVAALAARLRTRAQDSDAVVAQRMAKSAEEMSHWPEYEYVIINDDLAVSVEQAEAIVAAERLQRQRELPAAIPSPAEILKIAGRLRRVAQPGLEEHVKKLRAA
ncbi:MAG TPA: hypothetical protein VME41_14005, partial [Stellaceae bacterium]|nr:hypothetical protein [Stellaceae bacterium]